MRIKLFTKAGLFLIGMAALCATGLADDGGGAKLIVGQPNTPCPNAQYSTIAAAVSAASPGDEIDICPALYPEQLVITKPLTLQGVNVNGVNRVLLKPALASGGLPFQAVITVLNTHDVTIRDLAIDASNNTVTGCASIINGAITGSLAGVHFYNASGSIETNAISGAELNSATCSAGAGSLPVLFPGNGYGVQVDTDGVSNGPFHVKIAGNTIHDFSRNGILVVGSGVTAEIEENAITGVGPASGSNQFGVFLALGSVGHVTRNVISQGLCGAIPYYPNCVNLRSEGIVLRAAGDGTVIDSNTILNTQSGIFVNGANAARVSDNLLQGIDALNGIQIQALTNSLVAGNKILGVLPLQNKKCGIREITPAPFSPAISGNTLRDNIVSDAYCGLAFVTADHMEGGIYLNTLYGTLNADLTINPPPPTEP